MAGSAPRPHDLRHQAEVRLEADGAVAAAVVQALGPELEDVPDGTRASAQVEDYALVLRLEADDLAGLRAGLQGLVRLADAALRSAAPSR